MADDPTRYLDVSGVLALKKGATVDVDYTVTHARSVAARDRELGARIGALQSRLDALRIVSGATPGSQSDAEVSGFVWDAGSRTRAALDGLYVSTLTGDQIRATAEQAIADATDARGQAAATGASLTSLTDRVLREEQARTVLASRVGAVESDIGVLEQRLDSLPAPTPAPTPDTGTDGGGQVIYLSNYCSGSGADESAGLQAAADEAASTQALLFCDVPGVIGLGSTVTLGDERANGEQRNILTFMGSLRVKALTSMDTLLRVSGTVQGVGQIEADGAGKASFSVYFKNYGRMTLDRVHGIGALVSGVAGEPSGNNNSWTINKLRVITSGSKVVTTATVASRSAESGWASTGDSAPYTTWTLATPLPTHMVSRTWAVPAVVFSDGRAMAVRRVVDARTVEVFNEDRPVGTTDTLTLATAAVAFPYYGDVGIWTIGNADIRQNANAWAMSYGGYGGFVGQWAQQANLAGVFIPKWAIGLTFGAFYTELSGSAGQGTPWLAVRSTAMTTISVGPGTNAEPENWQGMDLSWMKMTGRNNQPLHWQMFKRGASPLSLPPATPLDSPKKQPGTTTITPGTFQVYQHTSGSPAYRIDNAYTAAPGHLRLSTPKVGSGMVIQIGLVTKGTQTVMGTTIIASKAATGTEPEVKETFWQSPPVWGDVDIYYWLLEGTTDWIVSIDQPTIPVTTSIAYTPAYVGQVAVSGGQAYIAVGAASASDWKQVTS